MEDRPALLYGAEAEQPKRRQNAVHVDKMHMLMWISGVTRQNASRLSTQEEV